jgi:hypothetical protein
MSQSSYSPVSPIQANFKIISSYYATPGEQLESSSPGSCRSPLFVYDSKDNEDDFSDDASVSSRSTKSIISLSRTSYELVSSLKHSQSLNPDTPQASQRSDISKASAMIRNPVGGHFPARPRMSRSLYYVGQQDRRQILDSGFDHGIGPHILHGLLDAGEDKSDLSGDASVSSRATIRSDELDFIDDGSLPRPDNKQEQEQEQDLPPAMTLEDLDDIKQSPHVHSAPSSMDNMRAAIDTARIDALYTKTSNSPRQALWVGIPPLHHQTEFSIPHTADGFPDNTQASVMAPINFRRCSVRRSVRPVAMPPPTRKAEMALKEMPTHLLPFVPYIEKRTDENVTDERALKARTMNVDIIRGWLNECDQRHNPACCSKQSDSSLGYGSLPLYLIDVKDGCIIPTPGHSRYVALSYVWGGGEASTCATRANLQELQKPEGLYRRHTSLPRTIMDAIHLTDSLGERYLWIDRLCIVQDDEATKQHQLSSMGEIYAGAFFTLVAAQNEEASLGLYGRRRMTIGPAEPPNKKSVRRPSRSSLSDRQIMLTHAMSLMQTKWYSRGWTFQEYIFSRRRVIFHNGTVNWECLCSSWHEGQTMSNVAPCDAPLEKVHPSRTGLKLTPWPDMFRYTRLTSLFNERDLTYPEDVLDAFAGCLHHLSRVFPGGFISGMPTMCFDAALLWQPWVHMKRRKSRKLPLEEAVLPSWSWAGWEGVINSESLRSAANYQFENPAELNPLRESSWKTYSTVQWLYSENLDSERHAITVPSQFARPSFAKIGDKLPPGWTTSAETGDGVVHHSCDPTTPFRFPIPIVGVEAPRQPVINARYLHCTTKRAFLTLGNEVKSKASNCPAVQLTTLSGRWAGVFRLNCLPYECQAFLDERRCNAGGQCELIEMSAGSVENQSPDAQSFDEWEEPGCGRTKGLYEFVNVLWIERDEEVAYRKALGRVRKDVWETEAKESVDITIG